MIECTCGNIHIRGKRGHSDSLCLCDGSVRQPVRTLRCYQAGCEIDDMSLVSVGDRGCSTYVITCLYCGDKFAAKLHPDYLHISHKDEEENDRWRRRTFDGPGPGISLIQNFPLGLRKFLVQAKKEVRLGETVNDDVVDVGFETHEWLSYSFTPHIVLPEFSHENSC